MLDEVTAAVDPELIAGVLEQNKPETLFATPEHPRTRQFLDRIIRAGRL